MNSYERMLIDISNVYYRAYMVSSPLPVEVKGELINTGGIKTTLLMIEKLKRNYLKDGGKVYYLFDNATSKETMRTEIDPEYKANRKKRSPMFYRGLDYLYLVLQSYDDNSRLIRKPNCEADDLVKPIIKSFKKPYKTLLVSNDFDWSRAIAENIHWLTHKDKGYLLVDKETFFDSYGFNPTEESICLYKALKGDTSDNIPIGVQGLRSKDVIRIVDNYNITTLYDNLRDIDFLSLKWKNHILSAKGRVKLNHQLVEFKSLSFQDVKEVTELTRYNKKILDLLYRALNFEPSEIDNRFQNTIKDLKMFDFFGEERIPRAKL